MAFNVTSPHPHHQAHLLWAVSGIALALTVAFHFLIGEWLGGWPLVLFAGLVIAGLVALAAMMRARTNAWAYLLLIPFGLSGMAELLYASPVVRDLGFLITVASLALFSYWFAAPATPFADIRSLWRKQFFLDTFLPFRGLGILTQGGSQRRVAHVMAGFVIAVPLLIVIGALFAGADPFFRQTFVDLFNTEQLFENLVKLLRDSIILLFFLGGGALLISRIAEAKRPKEAVHEPAALEKGITATLLGSLNLLFAVFLAFQLVYFFGGSDAVRLSGMTYAEYARQGFWQLLAVAGIVFALVWAFYRQTGMKDWTTRVLSLALIGQTGVVIASAVRRLLLYVDAYGLTVSRWWAMVVILLIAAVLLTAFLGALLQKSYHDLAKVSFVGLLIAVSGLLLVNVEGQVARYNISRFLAGQTEECDTDYLKGLSTDAVPALVRYLTAQHNLVDVEKNANLRHAIERKVDGLELRRETFSSLRARAALQQLKDTR